MVKYSESIFEAQLFSVCIILLVILTGTFYRGVGFFFDTSEQPQERSLIVEITYAVLGSSQMTLIYLLIGTKSSSGI